MTSLWTKATLGVVAGATLMTVAAPADAQRYRRHYNRDNTGTAVVAGIAGLAIGAALASGDRDRRYYDRRYDYDRRYNRRGYYNDRYDYPRSRYYDRGYDRGGYERCYTRRVYDPYIGRRVTIERSYAC